jgi:predicted glycogen debranching enzyme
MSSTLTETMNADTDEREYLREASAEREWLLTNGLGGYAAGTVEGIATRRYHGLLIGAFPPPYGRVLLLAQLEESLVLPSGEVVRLHAPQPTGILDRRASPASLQFELEHGLPVWRYRVGSISVEKRLVLVHGDNRVAIGYRLLAGAHNVELTLQPLLHLRFHDANVDAPLRPEGYSTDLADAALTIERESYAPRLRIHLPHSAHYADEPRVLGARYHATEDARGYPSRGDVWCPGRITVRMETGSDVTLVADDGESPTPFRDEPAFRRQELDRQERLLSAAGAWARPEPAATLVRAADAFVISPRRREASPRARTIIAGYHWFTDWGRDTMIALEGLCLTTCRFAEARDILLMFGQHVKHGLIPNLFPESDTEGLYHTADATLWFFHALDRYRVLSGDETLVEELLPTMRGIIAQHITGTDFGIGVDAADGLLRQGAEGYQLTWMDAKVGDWVVTPRRGKAVEINALWYNALRLTQEWESVRGHTAEAGELGITADRVRAAFNERFWIADGGYCHDVVDGENGDDAAFRPNQLFAVSLPHAVLDARRWESVVRQVADRLLTPVGLRSLTPDHPDYRPWYFGELRARDAAYHQGTVWGWLIGPFIDAWIRVHPDRAEQARRCIDGLIEDLHERACLGSISEIYDAEPPHTPRGCVAQAWSVAEALRCWHRLAELRNFDEQGPSNPIAG